MQQRRNVVTKLMIGICTLSLLSGCASAKQMEGTPSVHIRRMEEPVRYQVDPATFSLDVFIDDQTLPVSQPGLQRRVDNLMEQESQTSWDYPEDGVSVKIRSEKGYVQVDIVSLKKADNAFTWPLVAGEQYYLPIGEGKRVPHDDSAWSDYLSGKELSAMEQLSMPFWTSVHGEYGVMVIMEQPYRSKLMFEESETISFQLEHQYPEIDNEKANSFRIYPTDNNPVSSAKLYRSYVQEEERFVSLKEKAAKNPAIEKLYGAPHIYLWGENLLTPDDINWSAFRKALDHDTIRYILSMNHDTEAADVFAQIATQDYVDNYQKNLVCRVLSDALKREDFYNEEALPLQNAQMKEILIKASDTRSPVERLELHKQALAANLPDVFQPVSSWMDTETVDLLQDMKEAGIEKAWIGLNSWEQAYAKPELVEAAEKQGYLMASYDSYHSIHKPGSEQWITAKFPDTSLYDAATILNQDGTNATGFQNVGRKLNPTLSLPSVKERLSEIMSTDLPFNSWFIDCDATGEIYDDYSPQHPTTQQQDLAARLQRMSYIRDEYQFVIGSEGGNDVAASTIAFAHGIELPTFSWMDDDMKKNKKSPYYIGNYYSPSGGVAQHFAKQIPVKDKYYPIFLDARYDLPLFKLVYNDSVITSYHWDWSTFKIKDAVADRMLREILYNTPPLYHLDSEQWTLYKQAIIEHNNVWSTFHELAVQQEMTNFVALDDEALVQQSTYGEDLSVIANFSDAPYAYNQQKIPPHSLLLNMQGKTTIYSPATHME